MWQEVVTWASIVCVILTIAEHFEKVIKPDIRKEIVDWLGNFRNRQVSDIVTSCNRIFLQLFEQFYYKNNSNILTILWIGVISGFSCALYTGYWILGIGLVARRIPITPFAPPLEGLLLYSFVMGIFFGFVICYHVVPRPLLLLFPFFLLLFSEKISIFWLCLPLFLIILLHILINYIMHCAKIKLMCVLTGVRFLMIFVLFLVIDQILNLFSINAFLNVSITPHLLIVKVHIIGLIVLIALVVGYLITLLDFDKIISPIRAMLTSLLAILIIGLLWPPAALSFISDLKVLGLPLLSIMLLNLFADSLSLVETRIILHMTSTGSITKFLTLLVVDFFASALIFLVIPFSTGNISLFLEAIFFRGDRPWLGILFWSTFFTSICFYLFLLSSLFLAILREAVRGFFGLERILLISEKPIRCFGLVFSLIFTILYAIKVCT